MKHLGTKTIETDRLILRKFCCDDIKPAYYNWCNDDRVTKYLTWQSHENIEVTKGIIESWIKDYENNDFYQWAIVLKEIGEPIGSISITKTNEKTSSAEIGYCIGYQWWNKGITSEAFSAIIKFIFEELNANSISARHDTNNQNSGYVMKKCGLKYDGTLRQSDYNNQGIVDAAYYSILSEEYNK